MEKVSLIVVEDQAIFRKGLRMMLNEMPEVVLTAELCNGKEFLQYLEKAKIPDIVLMDIKMPVMDGIEATIAATEKYPGIRILVLSMFGEEEYLIRMLEAGIRGFLLKNVEEDELRLAIKTVAGDKNYFSNELLPALTNSFIRRKNFVEEQKGVLDKLSARELEILHLICLGYTNKEIADKCFISDRTAGGHRNNLLSKTGCRNTAELVSFAIKFKLINL
jgi:DNA-binding NarL/FixJ family response regulator